MTEPDTNSLSPLAGRDGEPAFEEPWQAQVLAVADSLVQRGVFSPGDWSAALGAALRAAERQNAEDNQETYYRAALEALETLVADRSVIDRAAMARMRDDWADAYRRTPHGQPVELDR